MAGTAGAETAPDEDPLEREELQQIVDGFVRGTSSAPIALMELLLATEDVARTAAVLAQARGPAAALATLRALLDEHAQGCATITEMLHAGLDSSLPASSVDAGLAETRALFDDSVSRSPSASVALYSLGSEALLSSATAEVVEQLGAWAVLGADRDALEIGCGIGRLLGPLSQRLRTVTGIDLSPRMVEVARERSRQHPNVSVLETNGRDLGAFGDTTMDVVLAIDSFPYIVRAGMALVRTQLREAHRVLRPGGDLVILNYSYGHSRPDAAAEVNGLARESGFAVVQNDVAPFRLWNAIGYHLRRA